jgi:hypothetical protein
MTIYADASFSLSSTRIAFPNAQKLVWKTKEFASSNGTVASVQCPALQPLFEEGVAAVIHVGDVVRINVEGCGEAGWLVLVTQLYEPDSVRGSFLCLGRGVRLFTITDVRSVHGCHDAVLQLEDNEVLLSQWKVSFKVISLQACCGALLLMWPSSKYKYIECIMKPM